MPCATIYHERSKLTILLNREEREALKEYASRKGIKVNPLIRGMILETIKSA